MTLVLAVAALLKVLYCVGAYFCVVFLIMWLLYKFGNYS